MQRIPLADEESYIKWRGSIVGGIAKADIDIEDTETTKQKRANPRSACARSTCPSSGNFKASQGSVAAIML